LEPAASDGERPVPVGSAKPDAAPEEKLIVSVAVTVDVEGVVEEEELEDQEDEELQELELLVHDEDEDVEVNEEHEELHDALSPHFDQLKKKRFWWILEFLPLVHLHHKEDGTTMKVISINLGRPRRANGQKVKPIKVHRSVKMRMEAEAKALGKKYSPRVRFEAEPVWVD